MQKFAGEIKGTNVLTRREKLLVGKVTEFIINPANCFVIGLSLELNDRKKSKKVVNASSVLGLGTDFVMIESLNDIADPDEIVRIKDILDQEIQLFNARVFTEDNFYLGKVRDFTISLEMMALERLYVKPSNVIQVVLKDHIIVRNDILKVERERITVKSGKIEKGAKFKKPILNPNEQRLKSLDSG